MTKEEFEQRIGHECTKDEYTEANAVYMSTDLDKDLFCDDWKRHSDSLIISDLMAVISSLKDERSTLKEKCRRLVKVQLDENGCSFTESMYSAICNVIGEDALAVLALKEADIDCKVKSYLLTKIGK